MYPTNLPSCVSEDSAAGSPLNLVQFAPDDKRTRGMFIYLIAACLSPYLGYRRLLIGNGNLMVPLLDVVSVDAGVPYRIQAVLPRPYIYSFALRH